MINLCLHGFKLVFLRLVPVNGWLGLIALEASVLDDFYCTLYVLLIECLRVIDKIFDFLLLRYFLLLFLDALPEVSNEVVIILHILQLVLDLASNFALLQHLVKWVEHFNFRSRRPSHSLSDLVQQLMIIFELLDPVLFQLVADMEG